MQWHKSQTHHKLNIFFIDKTNPMHTKILIIGSGPAGYTAAIYASRAGLTPILYEGLQPGGQLTITTHVENYPGYPDGILGPDMMQHFRNQALRMGSDVRTGIITKVDFGGVQGGAPHRAWADDGTEITADAVLIATGASAKWLGIPSEQKLNGYGVSACAVCDGFFYRNQVVAVVGGGDTAAEEAHYLSNICKEVHLLVRKGSMRASKAMQNRVENTPNITIHYHTETLEILGDKEVVGVKTYNTQTQTTTEIPVTGFFVAIGHQPNTGIFKDFLTLDESGYIVTQPGSTYTNIAGVFACGDAQDKIYRQAVTAAGSGCMAALDAERWLAAQPH
jgi:thioredoxin reductase (NADPH)